MRYTRFSKFGNCFQVIEEGNKLISGLDELGGEIKVKFNT